MSQHLLCGARTRTASPKIEKVSNIFEKASTQNIKRDTHSSLVV